MPAHLYVIAQYTRQVETTIKQKSLCHNQPCASCITQYKHNTVSLHTSESCYTCRKSLCIYAVRGSVKHGQCGTQTCTMCNIANTLTYIHKCSQTQVTRLRSSPREQVACTFLHRPDRLVNTTMPFLNSLPLAELKSHDESP